MTHATTVIVVTQNNHGYPFKPECSCGCRFRGYVSSGAAWRMAEDHLRNPPKL